MKRLGGVIVCLLGLSAGANAGKAPGDWPQWRGAGRDGVSLETGLLDRWPEGGPPVLWRIPVGPGFSGVSIADGAAFTMWDRDGAQLLVALGAQDGKELWRVKLGAAFANPYGDGPRSTPLVDDERVYATGTSGRLVAVDRRTGAIAWEHDLVAEFGARLPTYGFASSPLAVGKLLALEVGGPQAAFVAFDRKSGRVLWASRDDDPAYSSPIAVAIDGVEQIVFWSARGLRAVSSGDGSLLWQYAWETLCPASGDPLNTGTPIFVAPDRIFIASGSGATLLRVSRTGRTFAAEPLWGSGELRSDVSTPVLFGGQLYGFDHGTLASLDVATGNVRWKARGFGRGSLIAADGKLIVLGEAGNLALIEAGSVAPVDPGSVKVLDGRNWTAPSLAGGRLYVRNQDELVCLDLRARAADGAKED